MTLQGIVHNGVVVFEQPPPLPEGTRVEVTVPASNHPTLSEKLLKYAGKVNDLPADMAEQHDHYLHGTPRR
jgi:hypothetical protein